MDQTAVIALLERLIEVVEVRICGHHLDVGCSWVRDPAAGDDAGLADLLDTLEHLQAYRDSFYATRH